MSSLLKEAIVDAKALREAALKNAESSIIDKYSSEVRTALDKLLEQEELDADLGLPPPPPPDPDMAGMEGEPAADLGLDMAAPMDPAGAMGPATEEVVESDVDLAGTDGLGDMDGENLNKFSDEGESSEVTINLGALQEAIKELGTELNEDDEYDITEDALLKILSEDDEEPTIEDRSAEEETAATTLPPVTEDEEVIEVDMDSLIDSIMEKLTVDMTAELSGWAGRPSEDVKYEMERELARRRSTDVEEDLKDLKKAQEELVFENNQISEQNNQYKQVVEELKENLQDVNLSNARLLYTNRVLRNTSLNERQKDKIVEAISGAGSVTEARTIYETLQSTVEAAPKKSPQSLSEAITRRSSVLRASRQESTPSDPFAERMRRLAGIN
jgi:hypothetical protein